MMTRQFTFPAIALVLGVALTITGCGRGTDAQFTESEDLTADEQAEQDAYNEMYENATNATSNPGGGDPFANGN